MAEFYGFAVGDLLHAPDPGSRSKDPELNFARDLLVAFLYYKGGCSTEKIGFWLGLLLGGIKCNLKRVRKAFKAIGELYLLGGDVN